MSVLFRYNGFGIASAPCARSGMSALRGWTIRRVAEETGATERYVRTVAKMIRRKPKQGSLLSWRGY